MTRKYFIFTVEETESPLTPFAVSRVKTGGGRRGTGGGGGGARGIEIQNTCGYPKRPK